MKSLNQYIQEKLIINKDYHDNMIAVKSFDELRKIIIDRYYKLGPGTKQNPIDFNDIDVSNLDSFCNKYNIGIFEYTRFKYIDISYWNVSNVKSMRHMFYECKELESVGDLSKWNVSKVIYMSYMFYCCKKLKSLGDISHWDVSSVTDMCYMFKLCISFNKDLSGWDVSNVTDMVMMFYGCESLNIDISNWNVLNVINMTKMFAKCKSFNQNLSNWDVSKVMYYSYIFENCPIKDEYKPKFK